MMLSRLTSVRLGRDQSALDFVKGLRDIKKLTFQFDNFRRDLIDLALRGIFFGMLRS
jgi:hypothetical protein